MARGKQTCKILKEIRRQIAVANGIELVTSECRYKGDCPGTCPKCEAEVRYLEQQLRARSIAGKAVALAGISAASLAMLMPMTSAAQCPAEINPTPADSAVTILDNATMIHGVVKGRWTSDKSDSIPEALVGTLVINMTTDIQQRADIDGKFELAARRGDSIVFSYLGFYPVTITVEDPSVPIEVIMEEDSIMMMGEIADFSKIARGRLDLIIVDEKGNRINPSDVEVYRVYIDEDGEDKEDHLLPDSTGHDIIQYYWTENWSFQDKRGKPLKEATLRIEAEGYDDPVTIKVKYPKRNARKTVKFKHKKKK